MKEVKDLNYYCSMSSEFEITTINYVILEDNARYFYAVKPFELTNVLGNVVAVLSEFVFIKEGENNEQFCYKLYKTKEGNWYDILDIKSSVDYNILRRLKTAMDMQEPSLKSNDLP